jgi:Beta-lactamase
LRFGDPVSKYVQGVPNGDNVTISELLKMGSGLPSYTEALAVTESLDHDPTSAWTPEEMLAMAFKSPSLFTPGKEFNYCNNNYALLGLIVEKVEGATLAQVSGSLVQTLGMKDTLLPASTSNTIPEPSFVVTYTAVPHTPCWMPPIPPIFRLRPGRAFSFVWSLSVFLDARTLASFFEDRATTLTPSGETVTTRYGMPDSSG